MLINLIKLIKINHAITGDNMQVTINGETETIDEEEVSISRLLAIKRVESPDMVSVQRNGKIVDRRQYDQQLLAANDKIEFLYFMGGRKK